MRRARIGISLACIALLLSSGCAPKPTQPPAAVTPAGPSRGGTLVMAVVNDPPTFDLDRTTWCEITQSIFYDSLVDKDMDGNISPRLATSWQVSDDGLVWTFQLREDVTFHCGHPFDAHAVKYRIDRMLNDENPSANLHMVNAVREAVVDDDYTISFHLKAVDAALWNFLGTAFGAPFCPVCVEEHGDDYGQNPCGTGMFKLLEYVPGSHLTVTRHEDYKWAAGYWENQGSPNIEAIKFRFIADEATRLLELEKGTIDYIAVPPQHVKRLTENEDVQVIQYPSNGIRYWGFNAKKWPWEDIRVRQAMQYAINKHAIAEFALEGLAEPLWSGLPPSISGYTDEMEQHLSEMYPYDPERTKQLLAEAGWVLGDDGVFAKDGKRLSVGIWIVNNPVDIRVAEMLLDDLAKAGVELKIEIVEQARLTSDTPKGLHETLLWQYGWYDPDILFHLFNQGGTRMHFVNERLQELLELGRSLIPMEERLAVYDEVLLLLAEECPWVVLYFPQSIQGWSKRVSNVKINSFNGSILINDLYLTE